jgi:hypothetical protein
VLHNLAVSKQEIEDITVQEGTLIKNLIKKEKIMNIKKLLLFVTIISLSLVLSSCNSFRTGIISRDDDKIADIRFRKIIKVLEKKDKKELKKMFSPKALKEANNIDDGIEYIMKSYKGKMKSNDGTVTSTDSNDYGKKKGELDCMYLVTTDVDKYIVFFIDKIVDTKNHDNVGLYMLQIIKESDREKEFDWGGAKTKCAGIYRPKATENK